MGGIAVPSAGSLFSFTAGRVLVAGADGQPSSDTGINYATGALTLGVASTTVGAIKLYNATNGNLTTIQAGVAAAALVFTLPTTDGDAGQFLKTDGAGVLSWDTVASTTLNALSGAVLLAGTANQITVGAPVGQTITLSLPQDIATTSTPQFGGLGIGVAGVANKLMMPSGGIIDFNAADVTLTHSANALTLAGGTFSIGGLMNISGGIGVGGIYGTTGLDLGWDNGTSRLVGTSTFVRIPATYGYTWTDNATNAGAGTTDTIIGRAAAAMPYIYGSSTAVAGGLRMGSANAGYTDDAPITELHTLAAAGTSTTATAVFPALSSSISATFRITTEITGCTSVQVGVAGDTTRFGTFSTLTAGQTIAISRVDNYAAQTGILFTAVGGAASFSAGVVRVNLRYHTASAPTS